MEDLVIEPPVYVPNHMLIWIFDIGYEWNVKEHQDNL